MDNKNKKKEEITAIKNEKGELETDITKIKEIFKKFYIQLFKPNEVGNTEEEEKAREIQDILFESIKRIAENDDEGEIISTQDVEMSIKTLKKKNTIDSQGWSNKIVLNGGDDIIKSLQIILDEIDKKEQIPNEWIELIIKSISKGMGINTEVEKRRGLFITNIISKIYEKIKMNKNKEKLDISITKYQCGGKKGRSTIDHIMTLNAIIEYNKTINSETYILFADAYKCFDKLNLKNCIIDMYKIIGAKEAMKIYKLNKVGNAIIKTPIGEVGPIEANEIVRQGTITGPKLCCTNTDKINQIGNKCRTYIGPNVKTETLIYVDDILNASSNIKQMDIAAENLRHMDNQKGYLFNNNINKSAILIINKKRSKTYNDIKQNVRSGEIKQTKEYKYLGEWYNEKGDHTTSLKKRKEKISYYIRQIKVYGNEFKLGKYALITRIKIYKTVVIPTIYHNIETWSNINKKEMEQLEQIQATILKRITEQRITTPYYGLLSELGIWPIENLIDYRRIMLLHNIITSKGERTLRDIINDQIGKTWKGCWMEQTKEICNKYCISINQITKMSKDSLKIKVKNMINFRLHEHLQNLKKEKSKLRYLTNFKQEKYVEQFSFKDAITMLRIRLNMIDAKCNYKGQYKTNLICEVCKEDNDTTEHIFKCKTSKVKVTSKVEDIINSNHKIIEEVNNVLSNRKKLGYELYIGGRDDEDEDI